MSDLVLEFGCKKEDYNRNPKRERMHYGMKNKKVADTQGCYAKNGTLSAHSTWAQTQNISLILKN